MHLQALRLPHALQHDIRGAMQQMRDFHSPRWEYLRPPVSYHPPPHHATHPTMCRSFLVPVAPSPVAVAIPETAPPPSSSPLTSTSALSPVPYTHTRPCCSECDTVLDQENPPRLTSPVIPFSPEYASSFEVLDLFAHRHEEYVPSAALVLLLLTPLVMYLLWDPEY